MFVSSPRHDWSTGVMLVALSLQLIAWQPSVAFDIPDLIPSGVPNIFSEVPDIPFFPKSDCNLAKAPFIAENITVTCAAEALKKDPGMDEKSVCDRTFGQLKCMFTIACDNCRDFLGDLFKEMDKALEEAKANCSKVGSTIPDLSCTGPSGHPTTTAASSKTLTIVLIVVISLIVLIIVIILLVWLFCCCNSSDSSGSGSSGGGGRGRNGNKSAAGPGGATYSGQRA